MVENSYIMGRSSSVLPAAATAVLLHRERLGDEGSGSTRWTGGRAEGVKLRSLSSGRFGVSITSARSSITVTMEAGMGEASLGAAVAARVPGVLGLASRPAGDFPPAPGPEPARRLAVPAGGRSAPALLRRDLVALRVGFLLERGDRDLRCRSEAGLLCLAERGVHVRVARGDLIAGVFCGRPSARVLNLLRGVEALLLGGRDATSGASGGGRRSRR